MCVYACPRPTLSLSFFILIYVGFAWRFQDGSSVDKEPKVCEENVWRGRDEKGHKSECV